MMVSENCCSLGADTNKALHTVCPSMGLRKNFIRTEKPEEEVDSAKTEKGPDSLHVE